METGIIPPNIHYGEPRKELSAIIEGRIKIVTEPTLWEGGYIQWRSKVSGQIFFLQYSRNDNSKVRST